MPSAFDPALAEFPTRLLSVERVIDLLPVSHAPGRIAEYRHAMAMGTLFPPVAVVRIAGRFVIADGHKRFNAYKALEQPEILVEVWPMHRLLRDQWRQVTANASKNRTILSRTLTDPAQGARMLLSTVLHWKRVVASLLVLALRGRP